MKLSEVLELCLKEYEHACVIADNESEFVDELDKWHRQRQPFMCCVAQAMLENKRIYYGDFQELVLLIRERIAPYKTLAGHLGAHCQPSNRAARLEWYRAWLKEMKEQEADEDM